MAYQTETPAAWPAGVYQIAVTDPVLGGSDGAPNVMGAALAKRALYQRMRNVTAWDAALAALYDYPAGACVRHGVTTWRAIVDNNVEPGSDPLKWERWGYSESELASAVDLLQPPGMVAFFSQASPPTGWLKANGALLSRAAYARLFAVIGTVFGAGDGATTFALPDGRAEFLRGLDDGRGIDVGRLLGSMQRGTLVSVDDQPTDAAAMGAPGASGTPGPAGINADTPETDDWFGINYNHANAGTGQTKWSGVTNSGVARPRNLALLACIKY